MTRAGEEAATVERGRRHDLANLLTCVGMSAGSLRLALAELEQELPVEARGRLEEAISLAEQIEYAGRLAVHLARGRTYARARRLGGRSDHRLPAILDRVGAWIRPLAADRARVIVDADAQLPAVHGSDEDLYRVLLNLAVNAVEAIPEGAPDSNEIRLAAALVNGVVRVEVRDTGRGLGPGDHERIYEDGFTTSSRPGAGHGLTVTRSIVERLGGRIAVVPGPGAGVLAVVELPVAAS